MTIAEFHDYVNFLCDKSQADYFAPEEIDKMLYRAIMSVFSTYADSSKDDNYSHTALDPFRVSWFYDASNFSIGGILNLPADYQFTTGHMVQLYDNETLQTSYYPIKEYRNDEVGDALSSQVRPVTATKPICVKKGLRKYQFYPKAAQAGDLFYLKTPVKPVFAYAMVGRVITQNVGSSVNPEFADPFMGEVAMKTIELLGINASSADLVQWSQGKMAESINTQSKA